MAIGYNVSLPVLVFREGKAYVAYTPVLDLATHGKTYEEAKRRFGEVVDIFIHELAEKGTLDEVLSSMGWAKKDKDWMPPTLVSQQSTQVRIPVVN